MFTYSIYLVVHYCVSGLTSQLPLGATFSQASHKGLTAKDPSHQQQKEVHKMNAVPFLQRAKTALSAAILLFSIVLILAGVVGGQNNLGIKNSWATAILLVISFAVLGINEGFQVGVMAIEKSSKEDLASNARVCAIHKMVYPEGHKTKMDKLFIGQSFLVVFFSFLIANLTTYSATSIPALDKIAKTGVQGVVFTVCMCQLFPSVLAKKRPFLFLSIPGVGAVIKLALMIADFGVLESLYLVVAIWDKYVFGSPQTGSPQQIEENSLLQQEEMASTLNPMSIEAADTSVKTSAAATPVVHKINLKRQIASHIKYTLSSFLTLSSLAFVLFAIISGYSSFPAPVAVQFILLLSALVMIFYAEGVKVAVISSSEGLVQGGAVLTLLQSAGVEGVERFMIGRQQVVVPLGFLIAQICSFGASVLSQRLSAGWRFVLLAAGIPIVVTILIFAQLSPQLLANKHRQKFLELPGAYVLVLLCLAIERLGFVQVTFFLIETAFGVGQ